RAWAVDATPFEDSGRATHFTAEEPIMPKGSKSAYTNKQRRKAEHNARGYKERGTSATEAKRRAWATVNKESGGGKKSGSGRGHKEATPPAAREEEKDSASEISWGGRCAPIVQEVGSVHEEISLAGGAEGIPRSRARFGTSLA